MEKNRLTSDMNMTDMLLVMSEGNSGAMICIALMMKYDPMALVDILALDAIGIYGTKLYMLWNDCCGRDLEKMKQTIAAFNEGKFTEKEIHENLSRDYAKPFI
ncbi:MAG: hypothetical protein IKL68_01690 [Clostridia bacterium]|nr:hypothetical protein [Clostridia bacterium]